MNSPLRLLNTRMFHHLLNILVGLNPLRYLSRGLSSLAFLSSSQSYETQPFSHPSSWFPHKLESEDHAMPWFCPKPSFCIQVVGFPIGLSPRTMQCLGSVQNLVFLIQVVGFPIGLGPRTMQCPGSVQNLVFLIQVVGFPIGLGPRTMQCPGSV